jgi:glutamyl-tRNA synthetase
MDGPKTARLLKITQWELEKIGVWNESTVKETFNRIAEKENLKLKALMMPFFVALSGASVSLPVFESMEILGRDMVLRRLQYAMEALASTGADLKGKALKELEASYESTYGKIG